MARGADRQLPAHVALGVEAHALEGDGEEAAGDLLAAGDDHVIFARVVERGGFLAQLDQPVGLAGHGGDDHRDLVAGLGLALDPLGDRADALDPGHRGSAEFHHDAGHGFGGFSSWRRLPAPC